MEDRPKGLLSRSSRVLGVWPPKQENTIKKDGPAFVPLTDVNVRPAEATVKEETRIVGGLNQAVAAKQEKRYDKKLEDEIRDWLSQKIPKFSENIQNSNKDLHQILKSGIILCNLVNEIKPNMIKNISTLKNSFRQRENITLYLTACTALGIPETALFSTNDLFENRDMATVLLHLQFFKNLLEKENKSEHIENTRNRISQIIKTKPKDIEEAAFSNTDNSWVRRDPDSPAPVEVAPAPRPVPKSPRTTYTNPEEMPEWKKKRLEKEQKENQEKQKEESMRRSKIERSVANKHNSDLLNTLSQSLNEKDLAAASKRAAPASLSNRDILRLKAHYNALSRIFKKRGFQIPHPPNLPALLLPPPKPDASARSLDEKPKEVPWSVQLKAAPSTPRRVEKNDDVDEPKSAKELWKGKDVTDSPYVPKSEDSGNRMKQMIAVRKKQNEIKKMEEEKQKEDEDKKFEQEKAEKLATDPYFGAGMKRGLEIWRIEKLIPVPWPKNKYGLFCSGDSYIVLQTQKEGGPWDIYFWLGSESSQDEKGAAALKTVELDDRLGGSPTQHREVQFHESENFLALFKGGIEYTDEGAVDSAFVKVDRNAFKTRLLHLKGSRNVRVTPVKVSYTSLNSGDVFILETASVIWQWNGSESSRREKLTGLQTTTRMRDSRGAKIHVEVVEDGAEPNAFWEAIGGKGKVKSAEEGGRDDQFEKQLTATTKLFHVSDASGKLEVTFLSSPPLKQSMLNSDDCHILDIGTEIFVWVGKGCTKQEKTQSMSHAENFLKDDSNRPDWVPITRVVEGAETTLFKAQFVSWKETGLNKESENFYGNMKDFDLYQMEQKKLREENQRRKIDMASLITTRVSKKEDFSTEGGGSIRVWRIENFQAVPVPPEKYGIFYGGDSYLIYFTPDSRKQPPLLYYWLGKKSTKDEQGAAVLLSKELAEKYMGDGIKATLVRVVQGKEPGHFLNLFKGRFVVRFGGIASGFSNVDEESVEDETSPQLFHIHGNSSMDTKAVQVPLKSASLNSADSFVLNTLTKQFVWFGKGCEDVEREFALAAAHFLSSGQKIETLEEEKETEEFWQVLGGKGEYQNAPELRAEVRAARLFHCSNASGKFEIEEIHNFDQDDLLIDDVFLLDVYSCVMVWVGPESNEEEKLKSFEMALEYVRQASQIDGRDPECSVIRILAGAEPPIFTRWFHGWDDTRGESDAYRLALEALKNEGPAVLDVKAALDEYKRAETMKYPYKELMRVGDHPLPNGGKGIDRANLEKYLTDEDFEKIFKMKRNDWEKVPKWKKNTLKQQHLLF